MSSYLLLTVLAIAANAASETTTKASLDVTTKRFGIQPLPAKLPGIVTPPSPVRVARQISVTTTPKNAPSTTLSDISATPTFPKRRQDDEDVDGDEKTFPLGNRPLFGGAFGQLFATRPNFGLPNLFGIRRPADQLSDLTIQSQSVPALGQQTFGATQTLSNQPGLLTPVQSTSELASQAAILTDSLSTDQTTSPSTTVTTNILSEATSTTTNSNVGQTTQTSTESSRKTRDATTESPFPKPKNDGSEDGFKPSITWTTTSSDSSFKPYALIGNLGTTQKPLGGIFSQTSFVSSRNGGSASAFASASSPSEGVTQSTTAQNKDSAGDGWYKPTSTAAPFKRDSFQIRERRSADQSTQKPQSGSIKPLPTTTAKPQNTRTSSSTKSTQKSTGVTATTPKTYPANSPVRPTRSAVTDSQQKSTKNIPTSTVAPVKRDVVKTTPTPSMPQKRIVRDTKSSTTTTQKPKTSTKKN